jgi:hypothetical protein
MHYAKGARQSVDLPPIATHIELARRALNDMWSSLDQSSMSPKHRCHQRWPNKYCKLDLYSSLVRSCGRVAKLPGVAFMFSLEHLFATIYIRWGVKDFELGKGAEHPSRT